MQWSQQALPSGNGKNKMPKKNFISSVLILLPFFIIAAATSSVSTTTPVIRSYSITSDCSNATLTSGTITASDSAIISPANTTYLSIGLPLSTLIVGSESSISAEIAPALTRTCLYSTITVGLSTSAVYTCADNLIPACVVTLTPL